jgi:hypothetical protein
MSPLNFDQLSELVEMRFRQKAYNDLLKRDPLLSLTSKRAPLTRWQLLKNRIEMLGYRAKLAWRVLRTGDLD